jgi:hypothetical protein
METGVASVRVDMDHPWAEDDASAAAVAEMLDRQRPMLTFDELDRVSRRLTAFRAPRRAPRRWSRLPVIACLSVGLLFTTAGSGLALSGFATPGAPARAQYPDSTPSRGSAPTPGAAPSRPHGQAHNPTPSTLRQIGSTGGSPTRYVSLVHAETDNELPFTGFAAIPVLVAGIALFAAGALSYRRTRES